MTLPPQYPTHRYTYLLRQFDEIPRLREERRAFFDKMLAWNRQHKTTMNQLILTSAALSVLCLLATSATVVFTPFLGIFVGMWVWSTQYVWRIRRELREMCNREQVFLAWLEESPERHTEFVTHMK